MLSEPNLNISSGKPTVDPNILTFRHVSDASDMSAILRLARDAHQQSRFRDIPFSEEKATKIVEKALLDRKRHGILLALKGDVAVGGLHCSVGEYFIGTGTLIATIHNINIASNVGSTMLSGRTTLGLLTGARTWAKARGAKEILLNVTSGKDLERTHKLMKRLGFEFVGGNYAAEV